MELKAGSKLASTVCTTEVIVVKAPAGDVEICCGGQPMVEPGGEGGGEADPAFTEGTQIGKRYADEEAGLEVLCMKAGDGSLSVAGVALPLKEAKPLPSSD